MDSRGEKLRILVVDDEAHARRTIRRLLDSEAKAKDFAVDEASDGTEAMEKITSFKPDIVVLDVEMPSATGIDVLRNFPNRRFEVIFVTAYSNFAIEAFDSFASDYLLKPVTAARFSTALARSLERLRTAKNRSAEANKSLLTPQNQKIFLDSFFVRQGARETRLVSSDIISIFSGESGTEIQTDDRSYACDQTLSHFEENLDPAFFKRVRRNAIINRSAIEKIIHTFPMVLVMRNKTEVVVAKERRSLVRQWLSDEGLNSQQ
jgi:two-component system LytT family response regulator